MAELYCVLHDVVGCEQAILLAATLADYSAGHQQTGDIRLHRILLLQYIRNSAARLLSHTCSCGHISRSEAPVAPHQSSPPTHLPSPPQPGPLLPPLLPPAPQPHSLPPSFRSLHSSDTDLLSPPIRARHQTWGNRGSSVAALAPCSTLWNSLHKHIHDCIDLHSFRSIL